MRVRTYTLVLILAAATLVLTPFATADTRLTYTGGPFTAFANGWGCPSRCNLSGWLTVSDLTPNMSNALVTVTGFDFTDGVTDMTQANAFSSDGSSVDPLGYVQLSTDSSGNVIYWSMEFGSKPQWIFMTEGRPGLGTTDVSTYNYYLTGAPGFDPCAVSYGGGTMVTTPEGAVPEPATLALLAVGVAPFMRRNWRRKINVQS